jgi:hypothetical protein
MPDRSTLAITLVTVGLLIAVVGVLVWVGALSWFGRLPGDIRLERPGVRFYAPLASMIVISIIVTTLLAVLRRLLS